MFENQSKDSQKIKQSQEDLCVCVNIIAKEKSLKNVDLLKNIHL